MFRRYLLSCRPWFYALFLFVFVFVFTMSLFYLYNELKISSSQLGEMH